MKKIAVIIISLFIANFAVSQTSSIIPIIQQTADYIQLIETKYEQKVVHLEYDVIKMNKEIYRQMFVDVQYGIILFGDENFNNFVLKITIIKDGEIEVISNETGNDGMVMQYITFEETNYYKFEIIADLKDDADFGYYSFLIFR